MKKKFITSALPYANGPIHIGHLVEYIQTDIYVKYLKSKGEKVIYICADDAHGAPIEINASKQGISPKELITKYSKEHQEDFSSFQINFDNYYSTDSPENKEYSDMIFTILKDKEFIYKKEVELTYCETDARFLPDRYVRGKCPNCGAQDQYGDVCEKCNTTYKTTDLINPYCSICRSTPVRKKSLHYFFKVSQFSDKLKEWLVHHNKIQDEVKNFILGWIEKGLEDWDISRDGPYFGFKIPGEENMYYYVWLDAPIGYFASLANYCKKNGLDPMEFLKGDGEFSHFIGKDIMYFHLLFWPAMLMGSGFNLPVSYHVHGFLTVNGEKMSKSRGTFLTAKDFLKISPPDFLRFYFAANIGKKVEDIDLNWKDFYEKVNSELVSNLANFCYRVISYSNDKFSGKLTGYTDETTEKRIQEEIKLIEKAYEEINLREAMYHILEIGRIGNKYFQESQPWKETDRKKAQDDVSYSAKIVKTIAIAIAPVLPHFAKSIAKQLNLESTEWGDLTKKMPQQISTAEIFYRKIEDIPETKKEEDQFSILQIKVGKVISVEEHPDADKLYVLEVDTGEKRQLVAGLRAHVSKSDLLGKHICVLTNLKPAVLRGKESQGMILAADDGKIVSPLSAPHSEPGSLVSAGEISPEKTVREITLDDFKKITLKAKGGNIEYNGKILRTDKEKIVMEAPDGSKVR